MKKGTLYIVATPIGNLDDITFRAIEVLKSVDVVFAEDTRYTSKLFNHFDIKTKLSSYRDQNHLKAFGTIQGYLDAGKDLALVSDSGTPLLSDPGYKLVHLLREYGYEIYSIPGPSALTASLSISGLPLDKFIFLGFLPKSKGKKESMLRDYGFLGVSVVIYESPYRLEKLLAMVVDILGDSRMIFIANDLTKLKEKHFYGRVEDVLAEIKEKGIKGEVAVVISKE